MRRKKTKKKLNTLDKYICFVLTFLTIYTIAHTVIFYLTGQEAKTLDRLVFSTFGGELLLCFFIKRLKLHEEAKIIFGKKQSGGNTDEDGFIDLDEE